MTARPTALIADDEPLLREALVHQLAQVWPELDVVAEARNGREAIRLFDERRPDVCFLDVHMPGLSGLDAANHIGRRAHVVFVTAYEQPTLRSTFGPSYAAYCRAVPAWWPRLTPWDGLSGSSAADSDRSSE